nr:hypothetical protein [Flavobacterium sp.]MCU0393886.1 hypothetical protein [Thermoflexibacter sp.]
MKTAINYLFSIAIFCFFSVFNSFGQDTSYKCNYEPDEQTKNLVQQVLNKINAAKKNPSQQQTNVLTGVVKIPLVVHVIEPSTSSSLITDAE